MNLRVILADDHPFVLLGVRSALAPLGDVTVVGEAANPSSLVALLQTTGCDVLVTDLAMPEAAGVEEDGLRFVTRIRRDWPSIRIVVLTSLTNPAILRSIVSDGVAGMLNKSEPMADLVTAIRYAGTHRGYLSGAVLEALAQADGKPVAMSPARRLSPGEKEVIGMFIRGRPVAEIARLLGRDARTVSRQKRNAMAKLGVSGDPGLFAYVRARGLV